MDLFKVKCNYIQLGKADPTPHLASVLLIMEVQISRYQAYLLVKVIPEICMVKVLVYQC